MVPREVARYGTMSYEYAKGTARCCGACPVGQGEGTAAVVPFLAPDADGTKLGAVVLVTRAGLDAGGPDGMYGRRYGDTVRVPLRDLTQLFWRRSGLYVVIAT